VANSASAQYLLDDLPRTLFPTSTIRYLVEKGEDLLLRDVQNNLQVAPPVAAFLPQTVCYAAKKDFLLRRTLQLDPLADLFIYDLVHRNRDRFRKDHRPNRRNFGYRFETGKPVSPMSSYREFRSAVMDARTKYNYTLRTDVALYFNSIYHHDLVAYYSEAGWALEDVEHLGRFLREINSGRSIDCLPHGLNPCKTLGAEFLKFVDNSSLLKSPLSLRFLDDIHVFADDPEDLTADLLTIQKLIGQKGLSLSTSKTVFGQAGDSSVEHTVDRIKKNLLRIRQARIEVSGELVLVPELSYRRLTKRQVSYLIDLLRKQDIDEADAELVLTLLTEHGDEVLKHLTRILPRFPALAKTLHNFLGRTNSLGGLDDIVLEFVRNTTSATEYQLFWVACIAQDYLSKSVQYGDILTALFQHPNATTVSQARILEIPEHRFGMPEMRLTQLRSGQSNWLSWSAAVGCRDQKPQSRNHVLTYFGNVSPLNRTIASVISR